MSSSVFRSISPIFLVGVVLCLACPAQAFGAGNIPEASGFDGYNWRHGDIVDTLLLLPMSLITKRAFMPIDVSRVYFGNWMRDYSQFMDVGLLSGVPEPVLRAFVSILGFMEFGYATQEFDVTKDRIGVYRPEEHIDNPKGYDAEAQKVDGRLRGKVNEIEYAIDPATGMKNYIANEKLDIATSSRYIRDQLRASIERGRQGHNDEHARYEAYIHLGAALHCLEDFAAHSNYVELALALYGFQDPSSGLGKSASFGGVFPYVGSKALVATKLGPAPPLVTGTFGSLDLYQSILGEVDDKTAATNLKELDMRLDATVGPVLDEALRALKIGLAPFKYFGIGDTKIFDMIDALRAQGSGTKQPVSWDGLEHSPNLLWEQIRPAFEIRDNVSKWIREHLTIEAVKDEVKNISEALDVLVYSIISVFTKPIMNVIREKVIEEKNRLAEKDKENSQAPSIFSDSPEAHDPTHSQIAKDHFDAVLNAPAGLVATVITNLTTQRIVKCWDDPNVDVDAVIIEILQVLHHPYNADVQNNPIQLYMLACVKRWWDLKSPEQKEYLKGYLTQEAVENNKHHAIIDNPNQLGGEKGPARFEGSRPDTAKPPRTLAEDLIEAIRTGKFGNPAEKVAKEALDLLQKSANEKVLAPVDRAVKELGAKIGQVADQLGDNAMTKLRGAVNITNTLKETLEYEVAMKAQRMAEDMKNAGKGVMNGLDTVAQGIKKVWPW